MRRALHSGELVISAQRRAEGKMPQAWPSEGDLPSVQDAVQGDAYGSGVWVQQPQPR